MLHAALQAVRAFNVTCLPLDASSTGHVILATYQQFLHDLCCFCLSRETKRLFYKRAKITDSAVSQTRGCSWKIVPAIHTITYTFTTVFAPWQGRFYKRMIGLVKRAFHKGLGCTFLAGDQFSTVTCEVEAILSSCPLTYIHADLESSFALIRVHFLKHNIKTGLSSPHSYDEQDDYLPSAPTSPQHLSCIWTTQQCCSDALWSVWQRSIFLLYVNFHLCTVLFPLLLDTLRWVRL